MTGRGLVHRSMTGMARAASPGGLAACRWMEVESGVMMVFALTWHRLDQMGVNDSTVTRLKLVRKLPKRNQRSRQSVK